MKKVRFLSTTMDDLDCHSPRPFIAKELDSYTPEKQLAYPARTWVDTDPVTLFETSNSIPYPTVSKSEINKPNWGYKENINIQPSDQLNLSFLDSSYIEPRKPMISKATGFQPFVKSASLDSDYRQISQPLRTTLQPIEIHGSKNTQNVTDNSFFIRRDNIDKVLPSTTAHMNKDFARLKVRHENEVVAEKAQIMQNPTPHLFPVPPEVNMEKRNEAIPAEDGCKCYHCKTMPQNNANAIFQHQAKQTLPIAPYYSSVMQNSPNQFNCRQHCHSNCAVNIPPPPPGHCKSPECKPQNSVKNKTQAIEKYEKSRQLEGNEIEKATAIKEKREPTVTDLFKIIKLQNEQLQLLQDKVDRFISVSNNPKLMLPVQNFVSEKLTVETVENDHKISIGVMTSFEIRTSIYNKEVVKAQNIQVSRPQAQEDNQTTAQPKVLNFLEGIPPVQSPQTKEIDVSNSLYESDSSNDKSPNKGEKTLNELSLYNVQVDNATTPLLSPEQTLYLDVRDYSDSDSTSDDQSNVGWTYYNKVMTHVNGMLQDSDMPSSASALQRGARQHCLQMQIDRTNVSVMKRVKFGDEPLPYTPTLQAPTETSMKMNQLAAKYLKNGAQPRRAPHMNADMSFATRKYMERHQLLHGGTPMQPLQTQAPPELPRFLDITALKQQPKFL